MSFHKLNVDKWVTKTHRGSYDRRDTAVVPPCTQPLILASVCHPTPET